MANEQEATIEFYVSVLFQTVEELSNKVKAFRAVVNSVPNAVEILRAVEDYRDPHSEMQHETYNALRNRAAQTLASRDLAEFGEVVRELRAKANQYQ
jgi:hypothetical protein